MFKLRRPCKTCPFLETNGPNFALDPERLREIEKAVAFQCHSTVDYSYEEEIDEDDEEAWGKGRAGDHPQQCAGLMAILHKQGTPNTIMQVGQRLGGFDPTKLVTDGVYPSMDAAIKGHQTHRSRLKRKR